MKRSKAVTSRRQAQSAVLDQRDLTLVLGGTNGTIIVENALPGSTMGISGGALTRGISGSGVPQGIQGSGHG